MLVSGLVMFADPFKTRFTVQIAESGLPFPALSFWAGQLAEISVGLTPVSLLVFWRRLSPVTADRLFYLSHLMVVPSAVAEARSSC